MLYCKKFAIRIICLVIFSLITSRVYADIGFISSTFSAQEDSGVITVSVDVASTASCPFGECYDIILINYSVSGGGSATAGVDFAPVSGQLSWTGDGIQSFQIPVVADSTIEPDETIAVTLNSCQQQFSGSSPMACEDISVSTTSATAIIINDDVFTPGTISLSSSGTLVIEGETATLSAIRTGGSVGAVSIDYATFDNTALSGSDYMAKSGTLSWANGESGSKTISLTTLVDQRNENDESFTLVLSNPRGGVSLGDPDSNTIIIENIATPGEIRFDKTNDSIQEGDQVSATVTRSNGSFGAISIDFATANGNAVAGEDYIATSGTLSWSDGESGSKTISVTTLTDQSNENDESFSLMLSNPSGGVSLGDSGSTTITIENIATPGEISFDKTNYSLQEGGQVSATVTRSNGSFGAVSVDFATANGNAVAGEDYTATSGTLSWSDGESGSKSITITTLTDAAIENEETFTVTLSNVIGEATLSSENTATVTIGNTSQALSERNDLSPDQRSVAKVIDAACASATGEFYQRCQEIYHSGLTSEQLKEVLDGIKPSQISAQGSVAIDFGFQLLQRLHDRIVKLRNNKNNKNRISLDGFTMGSFGQQVPIGKIAQALIYNALNEAGGDEPLRDIPLGFFITGQINIGDKDSTNAEKGFEIDIKSITLGLDYQFTDQLVLGIAGGYGHSDTNFDHNGGDMKTNSGNFSIYGSYFLPQDFYIDWVLSYSINDYDNSRTILYPGFKTSASSNPLGDQYGGSLGMGKDFYVKNFFISPYARIEYLRTGIDKYTERKGGGFALRVAEQSIYSLASTLGGQISQAVSLSWGVISPGMRFEWRHQFRDDQRSIQSQFIDAPAGTGNFSIRTDDPDRDYFNLGASLVLTLPGGRSAFLRYETRLGQNDITNHTLEAAIRIPF